MDLFFLSQMVLFYFILSIWWIIFINLEEIWILGWQMFVGSVKFFSAPNRFWNFIVWPICYFSITQRIPTGINDDIWVIFTDCESSSPSCYLYRLAMLPRSKSFVRRGNIVAGPGVGHEHDREMELQSRLDRSPEFRSYFFGKVRVPFSTELAEIGRDLVG